MANRRPYGQADSGAITASTTGALDGQGASSLASFLPYYGVAVAAGVTVWFITRWLGKKGK